MVDGEDDDGAGGFFEAGLGMVCTMWEILSAVVLEMERLRF